MRFFRYPLLACALVACSSSDEDAAAERAAGITSSAEQLGLDAPPDVAGPPADAEIRPSGLASRRLVAGSGNRFPGATDRVRVHYTGWLTSGERFDTSLDGAPAEFPLDRVIQGWTEGLQLMVEGESRRFWIPEQLAYQGRRAPYGMLVFDVQLLAILPK